MNMAGNYFFNKMAPKQIGRWRGASLGGAKTSYK